MKFERIGAALLLLIATNLAGQDAIEWNPRHAGDQWTYAHDSKDATGLGSAHLERNHWTTEETTAGEWAVAEGTLVGRDIHVTAGSYPRGWHVNSTQADLLRGGCLYRNVAWDATLRQLTAEFRQELTAGEVSPDFCFPLTLHETWGAPNGLPNWGVTRPQDAKDWKVVGISSRNTFHIVSISGYPGSGMTVAIDYQKGVGLVREDEIHHGTIGELHTRLIRFQPARH